jgi:hypothetical protein
MPIATPKALCPSSVRFADVVILEKARRKLAINYTLIALFVLVFLTCSWLIGKNVVEIYTVYQDWKASVRATREERSKGFFNDPMDPMYDDEVYPNTYRDTYQDMRSENAAIRQKMKGVKKEYAAYNRALLKSKKTEDVIDEKILSNTHDDYKRAGVR